jgi:hypothetical protein
MTSTTGGTSVAVISMTAAATVGAGAGGAA